MVILRTRFFQKHGLVFHSMAYLKKHFANLLCHVHNSYHSEMSWCLKEFCILKGILTLKTVQYSRKGICVYKNAALPKRAVTILLALHLVKYVQGKYTCKIISKRVNLWRTQEGAPLTAKKALAKCLAEVGPSSTTLAQHQPASGQRLVFAGSSP